MRIAEDIEPESGSNFSGTSRETRLSEVAEEEKTDDSYEEISFTDVNVFSLARHGHFLELEEILRAGLDPNSRDEKGNTILIMAAQNNHKHILKLALKHGGHINMYNAMGNTALHFCTEYGYTTLGEYLLSKKADPLALNFKGFTAIEGVRASRGHKYNINKQILEEYAKERKNRESDALAI